jgi:hypothetical protein
LKFLLEKGVYKAREVLGFRALTKKINRKYPQIAGGIRGHLGL